MSVSKLWHYRIVDWSVAMMTREQHLSGRPRNNPNRHFQIVQKRRLVLPWRISFSVGSFLVEKLKCLTMLQKPFQSCSNWRKDCITFDLQKAAPLSNPAELHMRLSFSRSKKKKEQNKPWTPRKTEDKKKNSSWAPRWWRWDGIFFLRLSQLKWWAKDCSAKCNEASHFHLHRS